VNTVAITTATSKPNVIIRASFRIKPISRARAS
jgi:hypothetical protein